MNHNDVTQTHGKETHGKETKCVFVQKLYYIVNKNRWIQWLPCGKMFIIIDKEMFCQEELKKHFRHTNFPSFNRQLNYYGFKSYKNKSMIYYHKLFIKNMPHLLCDIVRKTHGATKRRKEIMNLKLLANTAESVSTQSLINKDLSIVPNETTMSETALSETPLPETPLPETALLETALSETPLSATGLSKPPKSPRIFFQISTKGGIVKAQLMRKKTSYLSQLLLSIPRNNPPIESLI